MYMFYCKKSWETDYFQTLFQQMNELIRKAEQWNLKVDCCWQQEPNIDTFHIRTPYNNIEVYLRQSTIIINSSYDYHDGDVLFDLLMEKFLNSGAQFNFSV